MIYITYKGSVPQSFLKNTEGCDRTQSFEEAVAWWKGAGYPQRTEPVNDCEKTSISGISLEVFDIIRNAENEKKQDPEWRIREICRGWANAKIQEATQ